MSTATLKRTPVIPNNIFGMILFVITEAMLFSGLISSYIVLKSTKGSWVPPQNITLPVEATAFNTAILLLSGVFLLLALKTFQDPQKTKMNILRSMLLASFFVIFQGYEWVQLLTYGMTLESGMFGATFFLLIGTHSIHAFAGIFVLLWAFLAQGKGELTNTGLITVQIFWLFIVGIWPILYSIVYF